MAVDWVSDLDTGISVIDDQHKRLLHYINQLAGDLDRTSVACVLADLVDYTVSHFAFEESLQVQAGYRDVRSHKDVHDKFIEHIASFVERHEKGDDVVEDLYIMLSTWLINHIKRDDMAYVSEVKANMVDIIAERIQREQSAWIDKYFK
jgi:hemerythrin